MWIRVRLDIGWRDLFVGAILAGLPRSSQPLAQRRLEQWWSAGCNDALACRSVRSGFDLLLQAAELPRDAEALFSAVTISDMPRIAREHGLVPVPVDVKGSDYRVDVDALRRALSDRSRLLVVAHLFGAQPEMEDVFAIARERNLLVVEDCAQAWRSRHWRGNQQADASLFSFGAIKTATALGGALCRVRDPDLLVRMREIQSRQPIAADRLGFKCFKFGFLKAISLRPVFGLLTAVAARTGRSVDDLLAGLTRGFSDDGLFEQLRQQPSAGALRLLHDRLRRYEERRIRRRIENARRIITQLGLEQSQPELLDERHSFWLFPLSTDRPEELRTELRKQGFDSAQRGRMEVLPPPPGRPDLDCPQAHDLLNRTLFLPSYPEMPNRELDRMCAVIDRPGECQERGGPAR